MANGTDARDGELNSFQQAEAAIEARFGKLPLALKIKCRRFKAERGAQCETQCDEEWDTAQCDEECDVKRDAIRLALSGIGRELLFAVGNGGGPLPAEELVGAEQTAKELAAVAEQAAALRTTLQGLHKPALDALGWRRAAALRRLASDLNVLAASASLARIPDLPPNAGKGRKPQAAKLEVARRIASHFRRLTGKSATRVWQDGRAHGEFYDLVTEVFELLGLGNPDQYAREAIKAQKFPAKYPKLNL